MIATVCNCSHKCDTNKEALKQI
ncbi:MAG: (Na+)-NQR maturation NqrM [Acidaminococcaceae bacterium]